MEDRTIPIPGQVKYFPDLSFHYGLSIDELVKTPRNIISIYLEALPRLLAQEQLSRNEAGAFPHMEDDDRKDRVEQLVEMASQDRPDEVEDIPRNMSPEQAQMAMAAMGIGVTIVEKVDA